MASSVSLVPGSQTTIPTTITQLTSGTAGVRHGSLGSEWRVASGVGERSGRADPAGASLGVTRHTTRHEWPAIKGLANPSSKQMILMI